ncbi:hypothetical protein [Actinokineospora bangkokensis]|uniref:hypothetical protein n=1 Tax=Actinokineospora bangkokensis TaxID=1193682 RepID=UPI001177804B|nr:hypothetical protein [Actinokineospora bangkokensis]
MSVELRHLDSEGIALELFDESFMKRADVESVLREYISTFQDAGFTGSRGNYRTAAGLQVKFVLDRWGWDERLGWGFVLHVQDNNHVDELGNPLEGFLTQIGAHTLTKRLGKKTLGGLYEDNPVLRSQLRNSWFPFDTPARLRAVLDLVLVPALEHARAWFDQVNAEGQ